MSNKAQKQNCKQPKCTSHTHTHTHIYIYIYIYIYTTHPTIMQFSFTESEKTKLQNSLILFKPFVPTGLFPSWRLISTWFVYVNWKSQMANDDAALSIHDAWICMWAGVIDNWEWMGSEEWIERWWGISLRWFSRQKKEHTFGYIPYQDYD